MMNRNFTLKIGKQTANIEEPIDVNELENYEIVVDPSEKIEVQLFIGGQEMSLTRVYREEKEPNYIFRGVCRFDHVGVQTLHLRVDGESFEQRVRVKPTKISQDEYETILRQIRETAYNIVYTTFGRAEEEIRHLQVKHPKSPLEFFHFFERNFSDFRNIFRRIEKAPNTAVNKRQRRARFFEAEHFEEVVEYQKPKRRLTVLQDRLKGLLPKLVVTSENFLSYDVYENRLLKHYLGSAANKLNYLEEVALKEKERENENRLIYGGDPDTDDRLQKRTEKWQDVIERCRRYRRDANRMRTSPFFEGVAKIGLVKTSMVLQKEPRYKAFYRLYRDFRKNSVIEVHSEYFHLPVTQLWRTYEMWVLLKVGEALRNIGFELKKQRLVNIDTRHIYDTKKTRFSFNLAKNESLLELHKEDRTVKLYYHREYRPGFENYGSADEKAQIPDVAIEIFRENNTVPDVAIVEVKYRVREDKPPESAKNELSHYVNMIRDKQRKRIVSSAYIAYPGTLTRSTKRGDYGYIGLTPSSDMEQFEQKILEMVS